MSNQDGEIVAALQKCKYTFTHNMRVYNVFSFIQIFVKRRLWRSISMKGNGTKTMRSQMTFKLYSYSTLGLNLDSFIHTPESGVIGHNLGKGKIYMAGKMKKLSWLYPSSKLLFLLSLATTQLIIFGIPCIERFASSGIAEEKIIESQKGLKPPGITLCPSQHGQQGWREPDKTIRHPDNQSYTRWCPEANTAEAFESCIKEKTFDLKETVIRGLHGAVGSVNLSSPEFWTWDLTTAFVGRCFSLNYDQEMGTDILRDPIGFDLNETLTYSIIIHDPNFGLPTFNPSTLPSLKTTISNR